MQVMMIADLQSNHGRYLGEYYARKGFEVAGCVQEAPSKELPHLHSFCLAEFNEESVKEIFFRIRTQWKRLDVLINNIDLVSTGDLFSYSKKSAEKIFETNVTHSFLLAREAAKIMRVHSRGRIVNFTSSLAGNSNGEAFYLSAKAAVASLTEIMAKELADFSITVNSVGASLSNGAVKRRIESRDFSNVIDFLILPESNFITGQNIQLGGF